MLSSDGGNGRGPRVALSIPRITLPTVRRPPTAHRPRELKASRGRRAVPAAAAVTMLAADQRAESISAREMSAPIRC